MPRYARRHSPGSLVHVIVRFVNREFRLVDAGTRAMVLERLPIALARADWTAHAYALMSSHMHFALTAGNDPPVAWLKPFLVSVAQRLNRAQRRYGPVVAERAATVIANPAKIATVAAYLHNNPVRAGVVVSASASSWTSHRAWIGDVSPPAWLDVAGGLNAAGWDASREGRDAFDRFVRARSSDPRDPVLSGARADAIRSAVRATTALPLEVSALEFLHDDGGSAVIVGARDLPRAPVRWGGDLDDVVKAAARETGCSVDEVRSRSRRERAVLARRVVVVAAVWLLRRRVGEAATTLGVSHSAASRLHENGEVVLDAARRVAERVRVGSSIG